MLLKLNYTLEFLEFKHPFKIALNTRTHTPVVFVELSYNRYTGYGEASLPPYLKENHQSVEQFIKLAQQKIEKLDEEPQLNYLLDTINAILPGNYAAKAALDIASHDLIGKLQQKSIEELYGLSNSQQAFPTFYTIGITDSITELKQKIKEAENYNQLKIKLGSKDDKQFITDIRSITNKPIAVDVNQGWENKEEALTMINWLQDKNILFVEQPLKKELINDHKWLKEKSSLPIIADESLQTFSDLEKISDAFHGINIKLMKCGGIREAYKIITCAREMNLKILIGCMSETSCANSAAAALAGLVDWVDLDGPLLIKKDYFSGLNFSEGKIGVSNKPGLGIEKSL